MPAGCNAFALDTRSKRQWESKPLDPERAAKFREVAEQFGFDPARDIIPHGSYLINLGSTDPVVSNMHCSTACGQRHA